MITDTTAIPLLPPLDARIPKWSLQKLEFRRCPLCRGGNSPSLMRPDRLPVAFCGDCQLWYIAGIPPLDEIEKLYQGYWFSFRPKELSKAYANRLTSDTGLLKDDIRLNRLSALAGGLKAKRLLEIGCGCGELLVAARHRGASVFGNDISQEACSFVKDRLGIPVFQGPLSDSGFREEFGLMDMVVMSDLIEHPVEPLDTFGAALNVLKPGGLLLILTPNGGAAPEDPQMASQWVGFRVDLEHLQYFSSATVSVLADRHDCLIEHLETVGYPGLKGIDRPPADTNHRSWRTAIKASLRKSLMARRLIHAVRAARRHPDPRCGTYHLVTVLRKKRASQRRLADIGALQKALRPQPEHQWTAENER